MLTSKTFCRITNLVIIVMLIDSDTCDKINVFSNRSYNFEAVDTDLNRYVSFEELVRYVLKQQALDPNTFIEPILLHAKIFYQHDFNDDGKLSIFEWKRGEELISVIRRVLVGNLKTNLLKDIYFLLVIYC